MCLSYSDNKQLRLIKFWFTYTPISFLAIAASMFIVGLNIFVYSSNQVSVYLPPVTTAKVGKYFIASLRRSGYNRIYSAPHPWYTDCLHHPMVSCPVVLFVYATFSEEFVLASAEFSLSAHL